MTARLRIALRTQLLISVQLAAWAMGLFLPGVSSLAHPAPFFKIHEPTPTEYEILADEPPDSDWIVARRGRLSQARVLIGKKLIVHTTDSHENSPTPTVQDRDAELIQRLSPGIEIYLTTSPRRALELAEQWGSSPKVQACYPSRKSLGLGKLQQYAARPSDPYFERQWYLENRSSETGARLGVDLNIRGAWPRSRGESVTIAVVDDGVELNHPELSQRAQAHAHRNFVTQGTNGLPRVSFHAHGTAVAGLALAEGSNELGMVGAAPLARLASWVIFDTDDTIVDSLALSEMFQHDPERVSIQNHSWGNGLVEQLGPTLIEEIAVSNAVYHARGGNGVLMIRAGGNAREESFGHLGSGDSNDDGYASYPGVIAVGAVNDVGRAATYSSPGASLLLAVPGGEDDRSLFTTDRLGRLGFNTRFTVDDLADYGFDSSGFVGTSAAAPLVSGLCALLTSSNPSLTVRDVQQILLLSCEHADNEDPGLRVNGAGLKVSHNVGFGIPNAPKALTLASEWQRRPNLVRKTYSIEERQLIPNDALSVQVEGPDLPESLQNIPASPGQGLFPDQPTAKLSAVSIGRALSDPGIDLTGKAALIQRGENLFSEKINVAAQAGAEFAIIYNNVDGDQRVRMGDTYYSPIPAVFIAESLGQQLVSASVSTPSLTVSLQSESAVYSVPVSDSLLCEHVGLRVRTNHPRRGDLRIALTSPAGTTSILQHINNDNSPGPRDWTYFSTHSFFEASAGTWRVAVTDVAVGNEGEVLGMELILYGTSIDDLDADGLDDSWELAHFGHLDATPDGDPDSDGFANLVEYLLQRSPINSNLQLRLDVSQWNDQLLRIAWPSTSSRRYQIKAYSDIQASSKNLAVIEGSDFQSEFFIQFAPEAFKFFRLQELQP